MSTADEQTRVADRQDPPQPVSEPGVATPERPSVDEMGEWSFPASDPPATWTWDPRSS